MASENVQVGFIGCGLISRFHGSMLQMAEVPATIGPAYDLDSSRTQTFASEFDARAATSAEEVIANSDAVYVCTWTSAHAELVEMAATAGKAIFCEKPLAPDFETSGTMTAMVNEAGVTNQVGLVLRRSPAFRWLKGALANDPGRIMNAVFRDDQYLPTQGIYGSTWRADPTRAGSGTLLEHSIHDFDLLEWLMGPIVSVGAVTDTVHGIDGIEDSATVTLRSETGAQAVLISIWHDIMSRTSQRRFELFTDRALYTLDSDWFGPVRWECSSVDTGMLEGDELADSLTDGVSENPDRDFIAAIQAGEPAYPGFSVALRAHELADAAYRSAAADGQPMTVGTSA